MDEEGCVQNTAKMRILIILTGYLLSKGQLQSEFDFSEILTSV